MDDFAILFKKKHIATIFNASLFSLGSIIAISYLPAAITPKIEQILIYNPYKPNSSAEKYWVSIGVIINGIN